MPDDPDLTQARYRVAAAWAAYDAALDEIEQAIDAFPVPDEAFQLAEEGAGKIRRLPGRFAALRTRQAGRVWDTERMTLEKLGNRIGLSTSRAYQLLQEVKKSRGDNP